MDNDGKIVLTFFNNNLEVRGDFFPPLEGGSPISAEYLRGLLEQNRITYGVDQGEIQQALKKCVHDKEIVRDVLIAKGHPPVNGVTEYMQLNPFLGQKNEQEAEAGSVDHRSRSPFIIVRKDQALAKMKRPKPGKDGMNVHGEVLGHDIKRPEGVSGGENTRMEDRLLISNINGQLIQSKGVLNVNDSLVIKGPVGYSTGNIIFPGNVEIEGPVSDGFKIYSGGSVTIKQTFDVTDAITKNNLHVAGGIIGRGRAMVKVGGVLKTKFIGNCRVVCRKTINVDKEVINSHIFTLETLEVSEKGSIIGGEVYAVKGVRTGSIGKKTGKAARVHCGIDFTLEQEKEKANSYLKSLVIKADRVKELINDSETAAEKKVKMEEFLQKLEDEKKKTQARITELLGKVNSYEKAVVEVKGSIVPGTLIEICQAALFVTEPMKKVRIRLNRETNRLVTESL